MFDVQNWQTRTVSSTEASEAQEKSIATPPAGASRGCSGLSLRDERASFFALLASSLDDTASMLRGRWFGHKMVGVSGCRYGIPPDDRNRRPTRGHIIGLVPYWLCHQVQPPALEDRHRGCRRPQGGQQRHKGGSFVPRKRGQEAPGALTADWRNQSDQNFRFDVLILWTNTMRRQRGNGDGDDTWCAWW